MRWTEACATYPGQWLVVEAKNLSMSYGDNVLFENVNFSLPPGGIVPPVAG